MLACFISLKDGITTKTWVSWLMWLLFLYRTTNLFRLVVLRSDDDYHISSLPYNEIRKCSPPVRSLPHCWWLLYLTETLALAWMGLVGLTITAWTMATISWHFATHCCKLSNSGRCYHALTYHIYNEGHLFLFFFGLQYCNGNGRQWKIRSKSIHSFH